MVKYSTTKIASYLSTIDECATSNDRGDALENFIQYLFSKIPGVQFYAKDFFDSDRSKEIDLAFVNKPNPKGFHYLESTIIVECKNTKRRISSPSVGEFVRKVNNCGQKYGILVSLNGITGSAKTNSNAYSIIKDAFIEQKIQILLLNRAEIESIHSSVDVVKILLNKSLALRFRKKIV